MVTDARPGCLAFASRIPWFYDNEARLDTWVAPNGTVASDHFLYDNTGQRVLQSASNTAGSTTTTSDTISFDGITDVTITGSTTSTTKYYSVGGHRVAMRQDGTFSYLMPDFLGSNSITLRADGSVQAVQLFSPFGATRYSDGTMLSPFNFTGQRLDTQTGLLYYNARYYDSVSGRFTSADTFETNLIGLDAYAYVHGNPETAVDPTGHFIPDGWEVTGGAAQAAPDAPVAEPQVTPSGSNIFGGIVQGITALAEVFVAWFMPSPLDPGLRDMSPGGPQFNNRLTLHQTWEPSYGGGSSGNSGSSGRPGNSSSGSVPPTTAGGSGGGGSVPPTITSTPFPDDSGDGVPGDRLRVRTYKKEWTSGVFVRPDGTEVDLTSVYDGPSQYMPEDAPGMHSNFWIRPHVEAHAAALMRLEGLDSGTLYVNNTPCIGELGCNNLLPHMLPEDATLDVYFKDAPRGINDWIYRNYRGLPDESWRWPRR